MSFKSDLTRVGGFTEAMKIASLAQDRGIPVVNHGFTTYINVAAALHFLNSIPNSFIVEFVAEEETTLRDQVTKQAICLRDGFVNIPGEPGLGVELDEARIQEFRVAEVTRRWLIESIVMDPWRPVRIPVRQRRRHDFVLPLSVLE